MKSRQKTEQGISEMVNLWMNDRGHEVFDQLNIPRSITGLLCVVEENLLKLLFASCFISLQNMNL